MADVEEHNRKTRVTLKRFQITMLRATMGREIVRLRESLQELRSFPEHFSPNNPKVLIKTQTELLEDSEELHELLWKREKKLVGL